MRRNGSASQSAVRPYSDRLTPYKDVALDVATFTLDGNTERETDAVVYRQATIFRSGDYPDKNFSLTPSELVSAATKFSKPINIDLEHINTPLDGNLGQLVAVEPEADGSTLRGIVAYPKWLHSLLPNPKLSATWDRASKALVGLALVRNPRVPDAALFAAFSIDQAVRGKADMSDLEAFMTARFDDSDSGDDDDDDDDDKKGGFPFGGKGKKKSDKAKAKAKKKGAKFSDYLKGSESEGDTDDEETEETEKDKATFARKSQLAQVVHDVSVQRGAICREEPQPAVTRSPLGMVKFANGRMSFQTIHDTSIKLGAMCSPGSGQRDYPNSGTKQWQWEWPGVANDGRVSVGGNKSSHFSSTRGGDRKMGNLGKRLAAFLAELEEDEGATIPGGFDYSGRSGEAAFGSQDDATRHLREQNAQLQEENRKMRQQGIYDRAVVFADKLINDARALPVERESIIGLHVQAGNDDTFVGTASFSDGHSRVSQLEAAYMARPKHMMDVEAAGEAMVNAVAMFNSMKTKGSPTAEGGAMAPERRAHLLNLDSVGRKLLADEQRANGASRG